MIERFERAVFFFTLFSIILQIGKHFWPPFAFVDTLRVDYLAPTVYVSDIGIFTLFVLFIFSNIKKKIISLSFSPLFLFVVLLLAVSTLLAKNLPEAVYGSIKVLEFIFFGYMVSVLLQKKDTLKMVSVILLASSIVSSLAIAQFYFQRSIGGIFYYIGERTFNASTYGIAVFPVQGKEILRPYASFPHPNVLAFFLLTSFVLGLSTVQRINDRAKQSIYLLLLLLTFTALILTFSRTTYVCVFCFCIYFFWQSKQMLTKIIIPILSVSALIAMLLWSILFGRIFNLYLFGKDLLYRISLSAIAFKITYNHPVFGVGLNNFFYYEAKLQKTMSPIFLQPVHNIYLLVLSELGVVGLGTLFFFLYKTFKCIKVWFCNRDQYTDYERSFYQAVIFLFLSALFVGLFDHFFFTLQQGAMIFSLLLGLVWNKSLNARA